MTTKNYFIIDNLLTSEELFWLYHKILDTPNWYLTRSSKKEGIGMLAFKGFPGLTIQDREIIEVEFLAGYFQSLIFRIRKNIYKEHDFKLPNIIKRIHIGAKSSNSKTYDHIDSKNPSDWTILGFLNPIWNQEDGGELILNDKKLKYKPGRFVVFQSIMKHNGGFIKNEELNYWRITSNIILSD